MIRRPPRSTLFPTRRSSDLIRFPSLDAGAAPAPETQDRRPPRAQRSVIEAPDRQVQEADRKSTRLNSSHLVISYAVFCLKKKKQRQTTNSCIWRINSPSRRP